MYKMDNMLEIKQLNIKNKTYYFWDDIISINNCDPNLLKVDKKKMLDYNFYNISYITKKPKYNINSVNPLYLSIKYLKGFVDEVNGNKYLNIFLPDKDNRFVINHLKNFDGIKEGFQKVMMICL